MNVKKYNRGEMYWYINPDVKKENYLKDGENQDFLDNRPVLIISDYIDEYHSSVIIIPTTTSPHRSGIEIEFENEKNELEQTSLMPMRIRLVPIKYLKKYIGRIDSDILNEVYNALDYHHGRTKKVPDYVIKDKMIHIKIEKQKRNNKRQKDIKQTQEIKSTNNKLDNKNEFPYNDLSKIRNRIAPNINLELLSNDKDIKKKIFEITKIAKSLKKVYNTIYSYKDKYRCILMSSKEISKKYHININQSIIIKHTCMGEIAIMQLMILDKLIRHDLKISTFSDEEKITFLTIDNSELEKYIKKGETVINNYKSQFLKELNL